MPKRQAANDTWSPARPAGKVTACTGAVTVNRDGHVPLWLPSGSTVFPGDCIETERDGMAAVRLADGSELVLGAASRACLDHAVFDLEVGFGRLLITVAEGLVLFTCGSLARTDPNAVTIAVGAARVDVHDARIAGRTESGGGDTLVTLLPEDAGHVGAATVISETGVVTLEHANETTVVVDPAAAPTPGAVLQPLDLYDLYGALADERWREGDVDRHEGAGGGPAVAGAAVT